MDDEIIKDAENHLKNDHPGMNYGEVKAPHFPYYLVNIGKNGNRVIGTNKWKWENDVEDLKK